jgi:hypothetical protein
LGLLKLHGQTLKRPYKSGAFLFECAAFLPLFAQRRFTKPCGGLDNRHLTVHQHGQQPIAQFGEGVTAGLIRSLLARRLRVKPAMTEDYYNGERYLTVTCPFISMGKSQSRSSARVWLSVRFV